MWGLWEVIRSLGPEGRALMNEISALIGDPQKLPWPLCPMRAQREDG